MVVEFADELGTGNCLRISADAVTIIEDEIAGRVDGAPAFAWMAQRDEQGWWVLQRPERPFTRYRRVRVITKDSGVR